VTRVNVSVRANVDDERVRPFESDDFGERTAAAKSQFDPDETEVCDGEKSSEGPCVCVCARASALNLRTAAPANTQTHTHAHACKRKQMLVDSLRAAQCCCCAKFSVENKPINFYSPVIPVKYVRMFGHDGLFEHQVLRVCAQTASEALHSRQTSDDFAVR